jgi:hypothetical protein
MIEITEVRGSSSKSLGRITISPTSKGLSYAKSTGATPALGLLNFNHCKARVSEVVSLVANPREDDSEHIVEVRLSSVCTKEADDVNQMLGLGPEMQNRPTKARFHLRYDVPTAKWHIVSSQHRKENERW